MADPTPQSLSTSASRPDESEDPSLWIPIVPQVIHSPSGQQMRTSPPVVSPPAGSATATPEREGLIAIQTRWESNIRLRKVLVDHPIHQFGSVFIRHFAHEFQSLDLQIRLGLLFVASGATLQILWWICCFPIYQPRTLLLVLVFAVSFTFLAPKDVEQQLKAFYNLFKTPSKLIHVPDYLSPTHLRWILVLWLLTPTVLKIKTFAFLSETVVQSGWITTLLVSSLLMTSLMVRWKYLGHTPGNCLKQGIHTLYGLALLASLSQGDLRRIPGLAGPFLLATGTLLLSDHDDQWRSRTLQRVLRLTLRDILATVGDSVQEDEMLQLTMLRWIADFWSSTPPSPSSNPTTAGPDTVSPTWPDQWGTPPPSVHRTSLQWEELGPMLDLTTDQMSREVHSHSPDSLQSTRTQAGLPGGYEHTPSVPSNNGSIQNLKAMLSSLDVDSRAKPAVMAYKQAVQSFPPSRNAAIFISVARRCPAGLLLGLMYFIGSNVALSSTFVLLPFVLLEAFLVLEWAAGCQRALPGQPTDAAVQQESSSGSTIGLPPGMDPMCILLSNANYVAARPPPLLQVWLNICNSVTALEMGLTAARCAHTTVVAADFAGNILSLAQFGMEVSQNGWLHGLAIMVRQFIHLQSVNVDSQSGQPNDNENARYATAAVNALRNGQIVARNVQSLVEESDSDSSIHQLLGLLSVLMGHGWLWGQFGPHDARTNVSELVDENLSGSPVATERPHLVDETRTNTLELPVNESEKFLRLGSNIAVNASETQESTGNATQSPSISTTLDLTELMDLIAEAFERNLINDAEKNAFMETILCSTEGPEKVDLRSTLEGMKKSLQGLLDTELDESISTAVEGSLSEEQHHSQAHQPRHEVSSHSYGTKPHFIPSTANVSESGEPDARCGSDQEWREMQPGLLASDATSSPFFVSSGTLDVRQAVIGPKQSSLGEVNVDQTSVLALNILSVDVSREVVDEPVSGVATLHDSPEGGTGDEWVKWVGGGLAVLGAVVGGMALANASQHGNDRGSERENPEVDSFFIEELDDDDDNDQWVSVSSASNRESI